MPDVLCEVHVGDEGTIFRSTLQEDGAAVNVSTATLKRISFKKPDGSIVQKVAVFTTDGSDGQIEYVAITGDLDLVGVWTMWGYVEMPVGKWTACADTFRVNAVGT